MFASARAGAVGHRHAVAGGDVGVARVEVDLARAAGGEQRDAREEALDAPRRGVEHVGAEHAVRRRAARRARRSGGRPRSAPRRARCSGARAPAASSARSISRPVASRWWSTRRRRWPPSRPRSKLPGEPSSSTSPTRSNSTPALSSASIAAGPRSITKRTTSSRQRPAPASRVSCTWASKLSSGDDHRGDAALGVVGGRLGGVLLGDDGHLAAVGHAQRVHQPGDAAPEHQEVEAPRGVGGGGQRRASGPGRG